MPITTALRYHSFGEPEQVLALEEIELPEIQPGQALLKVLAAPVNPADFGRINGTYGDLAPLPATAGLEGVAEILEIDDPQSRLRPGQRVFVPSSIGSWQSLALASASDLYPAPEKLPLDQAAMGWVNPVTAWKLMHDFARLQAGDVLVQNAANSAVGKLVIQIAEHLGLKTVNLVRDLACASDLEQLGADIVLLDDKDAAKLALEATRGKKAKLALNSVGGASAYGMCKLLADGSPLVTFGGMVHDPAPFPTRYLIFNDISLRGFWVSAWYRKAKRDEIKALHTEVFTFMESAKLKTEVAAKYRLEHFKKALEHAQTPGKPGKILFTPSSDPGPH